jgi:hypothetical protein
MDDLDINLSCLLGRVWWRLIGKDISKAIYVATFGFVSHLLAGALPLKGSLRLLVLAIRRQRSGCSGVKGRIVAVAAGIG